MLFICDKSLAASPTSLVTVELNDKTCSVLGNPIAQWKAYCFHANISKNPSTLSFYYISASHNTIIFDSSQLRLDGSQLSLDGSQLRLNRSQPDVAYSYFAVFPPNIHWIFNTYQSYNQKNNSIKTKNNIHP